jgi:hypothetical protein
MAKRKLSPVQRQAIRTEIRRRLAARQAPAQITRELAKKYGIAPISARHYLRSLRKTSGKPAARKAAEKAAQKPSSARRPKHLPVSRASKNGKLVLVGILESKAAAAFKNAKEARRLLPRWQALVHKENTLESNRIRLERELRGIRKQASAIGSRIKALVGQ